MEWYVPHQMSGACGKAWGQEAVALCKDLDVHVTLGIIAPSVNPWEEHVDNGSRFGAQAVDTAKVAASWSRSTMHALIPTHVIWVTMYARATEIPTTLTSQTQLTGSLQVANHLQLACPSHTL